MIINAEQIITTTKARLRMMDTTENDSFIQSFIEMAARGLNASNTYTIQCKEVEIDCLKAKLPENYDELICFQLNPDGCNGCCRPPVPPDGHNPPPKQCYCPPVYYYDQAAVVKGCGWYGNYFYIQGGYIHFPSTATATTARIYYRGFNEDEDGFMIVDDEQERGLSAFAAYQFALSYPESYTPEQRASWNAEWIAQKNWINGKKVIREFKLQKPQISLVLNAVLLQKRYGGF